MSDAGLGVICCCFSVASRILCIMSALTLRAQSLGCFFGRRTGILQRSLELLPFGSSCLVGFLCLRLCLPGLSQGGVYRMLRLVFLLL